MTDLIHQKIFVKPTPSAQHTRNRYAQGYAKLGWRCLQQAHQHQFADNKCLKQASEAFLSAIQHKRQFASPYVGLAYVMLLLGQPLKAKPYLERAYQYEPQYPDIGPLWQFIQYQGATLQRHQANPLPLMGLSDPEALYEQSETAIYQLLKLISEQIPPLPKFLLEESAMAQWESKCAALIEKGQQLQIQLEWLDETFDISELRQKFMPLERWCERAVSMLVLSRQIGQQRQQIQQLTQRVIRAICHPPPDYQSYNQQEQQLEQTMDDCDFCADQLDQLEEQGYNVEPLLTDYHTLLAHVERWQEVLDEVAEQYHEWKEKHND